MHFFSGDEYYWKLVADFIGPQTGEGLEFQGEPCKNRVLIQIGLLREDNNFPWIAIINWLKKIFPNHQSADFRRLIEQGIATTLSLGSDARLTFLESAVNFNFVGPICDSIGVERQHLLELKDFTERAQSIEVTNGLILELSRFIDREKIAPVVLVTWLRNFNPEFCKNGNVQKAYQVLRAKIKKLKLCYRNYETRSHRRNAAMENLLQVPFELVRKKEPKFIPKKRLKREEGNSFCKVVIKEENESYEIMQGEGSEEKKGVGSDSIKGLNISNGREETSDKTTEALTLLDITMLSVQKLSSMYGGNTAACKQISLDLLRNQYILTCKEHPAMADFEKTISSLSEDISLASPVEFLNYNANFLVNVHDAIEEQIVNFEKEIILSTEAKLGRDKLPLFRNFVNLSESATSRYIHMACDILSPQALGLHNYRKHWIAFCKEKSNPSRITVNQSNKFKSYFEAAASLVHHHKEIALFFSDLLSMSDDTCPNVILESVTADANDSVIQSLVCVLAIIYCKILGPYWQLLKSGAQYSYFSQYLLCLYQKFLDWCKDPSTLLEPEGDGNVFLQFPLQEKTFVGVFEYCGQWHTNRDLIRACLKRMVKVIATVTEEHLKDFLPGGKLSQIPSGDLGLQLVSCTFFVLMAEYPFGQDYPYEKKRPDKSFEHMSSDSSQEDDNGSDSSNSSTDESHSWQSGNNAHTDHSPQSKKRYKGKGVKAEREEELVEIMDKDYIVATVRRHEGPCKTQQDVDRMLVRLDGKSRVEKREAVRCEIVYQKMILNNTDPNLDCVFTNSTQMVMKLKLALPRVKPGYSIVLEPRKTKLKPVPQHTKEAASDQTEGSHK